QRLEAAVGAEFAGQRGPYLQRPHGQGQFAQVAVVGAHPAVAGAAGGAAGDGMALQQGDGMAGARQRPGQRGAENAGAHDDIIARDFTHDDPGTGTGKWDASGREARRPEVGQQRRRRAVDDLGGQQFGKNGRERGRAVAERHRQASDVGDLARHRPLVAGDGTQADAGLDLGEGGTAGQPASGRRGDGVDHVRRDRPAALVVAGDAGVGPIGMQRQQAIGARPDRDVRRAQHGFGGRHAGPRRHQQGGIGLRRQLDAHLPQQGGRA
ncbi:hypothetical protein BAGA_08735, partial [Bacillus gaemokensis]